MQSAKKTVVDDKEGRAFKDSRGGARSGLESSSSEKKTAELNVLKEKASELILEAPRPLPRPHLRLSRPCTSSRERLFINPVSGSTTNGIDTPPTPLFTYCIQQGR